MRKPDAGGIYKTQSVMRNGILSGRWRAGRGIPADAVETEQDFCSPSRSQKPVRFSVAQNECVHRATPSFFPPAAPSGITHYTFVPKVVCQKGLHPPLETPPALSEMGTHTGVPCGHISSKSAKQKRRELSIHDSRAALFCPPSAPRSRSAFANICGSFANAIQHNSFLQIMLI